MLFFLSKGLIPILLSIKYEQQKKLYSLPTTISHEAGMSRPEVEVQKKIIQTYSTDRNWLLKITIPQPIKRKAIHATTYFAQLVWKIKYFFLTFVLGFISNLNKNRALRHYPSSGNPQFQDNNWIIHWTLHVLFIY